MKSSHSHTFVFAFVLSACLLAPTQAQAGIRVPVYGALNQATYTAGSAKDSGSFAPSGGVGLELPLGATSALEIDALYLTRKTTAATAHYLTIPVLLRFSLGSVVSLGAGAYYAMALGDLTTAAGSQTFAAAGYDTKDFGALAVIGAQTRAGALTYLVEGRYHFGMYNISDVAGITAKYDDLQILVGIRFGGSR